MLLFCKILTKTDIEYRLNFPTTSLNNLPLAMAQRRIEFLARYQDNNPPKIFVCIKRRGICPKPTIATGWLELVREKDLQVGDRLKFYLEEGIEPQIYRIDVERLHPIILFGSTIGTCWVPIL